MKTTAPRSVVKSTKRVLAQNPKNSRCSLGTQLVFLEIILAVFQISSRLRYYFKLWGVDKEPSSKQARTWQTEKPLPIVAVRLYWQRWQWHIELKWTIYSGVLSQRSSNCWIMPKGWHHWKGRTANIRIWKKEQKGANDDPEGREQQLHVKWKWLLTLSFPIHVESTMEIVL